MSSQTFSSLSDLSKIVRKEAIPSLAPKAGEIVHGTIKLRPSKDGTNFRFVSVIVYTSTSKHAFNFCKSFVDLLEIVQLGVLSKATTEDLGHALVKYANAYESKGIF